MFDWTPRSAEVIALRRASREELVRDLGALDLQLEATATDDLAGLAGALFADENGRVGDTPNCRLALVAQSVADLRQKIEKALALLPERAELNDPSGIYASEAAPARESEVCFLYPGQGSQAVNMLRDLAIGCPWSHELFREANRLLADALPQPLSRYLYPLPAFTEAERAEQAAALNDTRVAQPALGLVELFATDLLERFGIRPARVSGHSYGEHFAIQRAGCLAREDLLRLSAFRGQACAEAAQTRPGAMAAVQAGAEATAAALKELKLIAHLANLNAPDQTVIAGRVDAIEAAVEQLTRCGLRTRRISVSAAFHTELLSPVSETLDEFLGGLTFEKPALPVYSNTTGELHTEEPQEIRRLLARHFSEPVLFEKQVRQMHADGARIFIEVGPGKVLTDLVSRTLKDLPVRAMPLDMPGGEGWTQLAHLLARLSVLGLPVQFEPWFHGRDLAKEGFAEFLARVKAENTPKPTDWLLSPNKAEPVTPLPGQRPEAGGAAKHAPGRNGTHKPAVSQISVSNMHARMTIDSTLKREETTLAMSNADHEHAVNESAHAEAPCSHDAFGQFHATTRALLQTQQAQNVVLQRFLETQERILLHCKDGNLAPGNGVIDESRLAVAAAPVSAAAAAFVPAPRARSGSTGARPPVAMIGPLSTRLHEAPLMHVMLIPIGSTGDVYPLLGLGIALRDHGYDVEVVANSYFQPAIERAGLSFVELGSYEDLRSGLENPDLWHCRDGFVVLAQTIMPLTKRLYELIASRYVPSETVVIASSLALAARVAQEKLGLPLVTVHLQPNAIRSIYDAEPQRPTFSPRWLRGARKRLRDWLVDVLFLDRIFGPEINALCAKLGLPRVRRPLYQWWHSPQRVLGMFPEWFAPPRPDWPPQTRLTGFPLFDDSEQELPAELDDFLAEGPPPIVFIPGSAMRQARAFFAESTAACTLLGRRGILLTRFREQAPDNLPKEVRHFDYLPLSQVLPRAAALVSHGGIGTIAQALAAGVPHLVMPMAFDQFANAARLEELGVARTLSAKSYRASAVARALTGLLNSGDVAKNCQSISRKSPERNSLAAACAAIEELIREVAPRQRWNSPRSLPEPTRRNHSEGKSAPTSFATGS